MPKLIILALVAGAIWYGYKIVKRELGRVSEELREAENNRNGPEIQPLEKDSDGVYRVKDD